MKEILLSYFKDFALAGRSHFAIKGKEIYYFKISKKLYAHSHLKSVYVWFVYASYNNSDWKYLCAINEKKELLFSDKSEFKNDEPISLSIVFVWGLKEEKDFIHIYHFGRCSHCNRELTDETSVDLGIGPTCRKKLGL